MKISGKMVQFIHGPQFMTLGSRDSALIPHANRVFGAFVESDREKLTIYVLEREFEKLKSNLEHNGQMALTLSDAFTHESYQIKGTYLASRISNEQDGAIQDIYAQKLNTVLKAIGVPEEVIENFVHKPSVAVTFEVKEIFDQAPGPGAGKKISEEGTGKE